MWSAFSSQTQQTCICICVCIFISPHQLSRLRSQYFQPKDKSAWCLSQCQNISGVQGHQSQDQRRLWPQCQCQYLPVLNLSKLCLGPDWVRRHQWQIEISADFTDLHSWPVCYTHDVTQECSCNIGGCQRVEISADFDLGVKCSLLSCRQCCCILRFIHRKFWFHILLFCGERILRYNVSFLLIDHKY